MADLRAVRRRPPARVLVVLAAALVLGALLLRELAGSARPGLLPLAGVGKLSAAEVQAFDPLAYDPGKDEDFLRRGRDGLAHVLYAKSPGGAEATASRVDGLRDLIEAVADRHAVEAATLEALVFP